MKNRHLSAFLLVFSLAFRVSYSQPLPAPTGVQSDLQRVVEAYLHQFQGQLGEELVRNPQSTDYQSLVRVSGAEQCVITRYSDRKKPVYSYKAVLPATDDFEAAKKQFRSLFRQLNNLPVRLGASRSVLFRGTYEEPEEGRGFTSILFAADSTEPAIRHVRIELSLEPDLMDWKISLSVYEKEREDDEPGQPGDGE
ncbi:MAG TPA: hypothetical protein VG870_06585 [Chitinophagaceae bacterium]|nr:hypothetical protein [Chitinophagaceae bacterium]